MSVMQHRSPIARQDERRKMQGYFIKVGDNKQGPYLSKAAAAAESKALKDMGYDVKVVQQTVNESEMMAALGNPEAEVEIDTEDDIDFDSIFGDDDEGDGEGDDEGDGSEGDEGDDGDDDGDDDDSSEGDDDDEDEQPAGVHGWFKPWGKS